MVAASQALALAVVALSSVGRGVAARRHGDDEGFRGRWRWGGWGHGHDRDQDRPNPDVGIGPGPGVGGSLPDLPMPLPDATPSSTDTPIPDAEPTASPPNPGSPKQRKMRLRRQRKEAPHSFKKSTKTFAPTTEMLNLKVHLKKGDRSGLEQRMREISDPSHADYRKHLSKAEVSLMLVYLENNYLRIYSLRPWSVQSKRLQPPSPNGWPSTTLPPNPRAPLETFCPSPSLSRRPMICSRRSTIGTTTRAAPSLRCARCHTRSPRTSTTIYF